MFATRHLFYDESSLPVIQSVVGNVAALGTEILSHLRYVCQNESKIALARFMCQRT